MKNIKLLTVTFLFSSILAGCGMKGPLYQSEKTKKVAATVQTNAISSTNDVMTTVNKAVSTNVTPSQANDAMAIGNQAISAGTTIVNTGATPAYVQQVAKNEPTAQNDFIRIHNLPQPDISIYATKYNNLPRYIILFEQYTSPESAKMASKSLPDTFANMET